MRPVLFCLLFTIGVTLTACRGSEAYSQEDFQQVHQVYAELRPLYESFKRAYLADQASGVLQGYRREHPPCAIVDQIDRRDTIDPNVGLFQVSIALDDMCNAIEAGYAEWAKEHHRPYPKDILPQQPSLIFLGPETDFLKIKRYLRHPAALA